MKKIKTFFSKYSFLKWIGVSAILGALMGYFSAWAEDHFGISAWFKIAASFLEKDTLAFLNFIGGFSLLVILCLWMIYLLFQFKKSNITEDVLEENLHMKKLCEEKIDTALILSTIATIGSLFWLGANFALKNHLSSKLILFVPIAMLVFIGRLQKYIFHYHNQIHPDRTYDIKDMDPQAEYFKKLDEGEKWMVYQACYKTFIYMDHMLTTFLAALILYNLFFSGAIFPLVLLSIILTSLKLIYFYEIRRYRVD